MLTKLAETDAASGQVWESLPGFQWYAPVMRAKAGSEVLAVHKTETSGVGRVPLLVTKTYGTGKILFMGTDAAWRWRERSVVGLWLWVAALTVAFVATCFVVLLPIKTLLNAADQLG